MWHSRLRQTGTALLKTAMLGTGTFAAGVSLLASSAVAQPMNPIAGKPGIDPALSQSPPYSCAVNYYVDGVNGNDSNPGSQSAPWKTIQNADNGYPNTPRAGECVNVLPGDYRLTSTIIMAHGGNSNAATGFVVYRSTVPQAAHLIAEPGIQSGANGDLIMIWAPYIIVDGFNIDGNHSLTSGAGIDGCANGGQPGNIAHHFAAFNNKIHDMGGAGLSTCTADFISWQHNAIFRTSGTNGYQQSGVDVWQPKTLAPGSYTPTPWDNVAFGIVVGYNKVFDNGEGPDIPSPHTDGNGIIIDTTLGSNQCPTCGTPYGGNTLVLGNTAFNNGGGGVHVFLSSNVTIANNTVYLNYQDTQNPGTARGELSNGGSENINWVNNIAFAVPGQGVLQYASPCVTFPVNEFGDSGAWTQNVCYGAAVISDANSYIDPLTNLIGVNPEMVDPALYQFHLLRGSPAFKTGQPENYLPNQTPNIGAY
jgi:parallel beta-helix repeat protein